MSDRRRNEKEDEKRHEKEDEKRNEKQWDEKFRRDPVRGITLAIILIWGGIVALIGTLITADRWKGWAVFLAGTGVILLLKAVLRLRPEYRRPIGGTLIIGLILLGVGLGDLVGWTYIWPVILVVVGVVLVSWVFLRRR
jgi:hypothetical protein